MAMMKHISSIKLLVLYNALMLVTHHGAVAVAAQEASRIYTSTVRGSSSSRQLQGIFHGTFNVHIVDASRKKQRSERYDARDERP
jgi:hypothetical protein